MAKTHYIVLTTRYFRSTKKKPSKVGRFVVEKKQIEKMVSKKVKGEKIRALEIHNKYTFANQRFYYGKKTSREIKEVVFSSRDKANKFLKEQLRTGQRRLKTKSMTFNVQKFDGSYRYKRKGIKLSKDSFVSVNYKARNIDKQTSWNGIIGRINQALNFIDTAYNLREGSDVWKSVNLRRHRKGISKLEKQISTLEQKKSFSASDEKKVLKIRNEIERRNSLFDESIEDE